MTITLPSHVAYALQQLNNNGHEAYVVGGCVRDTLMGCEPNDWDITTNALPEEIIEVFAVHRVIPTGIQHGTVTVLVENKPLEITTYRVDGEYSDNRHPDSVSFTRNLRDDLQRRDFTINAMAYHPTVGIIDHFSGLADLDNRQIVCVGDPEKRFTEDALRILRALRFSAQFGFSIEKMTAKAIHKLAPLLRRIAAERVQSELVKLLCGENVRDVMLTFSDVFSVILPEIAPTIGLEQSNPYHFLSVYEHIVETIAAVEAKPILRLTMLFHDSGKPACYTRDENGIDHFTGHAAVSAAIAEQALTRLHFDRATIDATKKLIIHHDDDLFPIDHALKRILNRMGPERALDLVEIQRADVYGQHPDKLDRIQMLDCIAARLRELIDQGVCFSIRDLAINGDDLMSIGYSADKQLGDTLQTLLELVMSDQLPNERASLLRYAKKLK